MKEPQAFWLTMKEQLGAQFPDFELAMTASAVSSLRLHPHKTTLVPDLDPVLWADRAYYLPQKPLYTSDPWLHAGAYYVQDASSMIVAHALKQVVDLGQPLRVLDLCGAPGGKTTLLAGELTPDSLLVTNDVIRSRANILMENTQKWGLPHVVVANADPVDYQSLPGFFDVMLVDAPCSGEGLFRKDPAAMDQWSSRHVQLCVERQRRILMDAWEALRPGGILIYATCTYNLAENEENLQWLADRKSTTSLSLTFPDTWGIEASELNGIHGYRFYPHKVRGEGLFISLLQKGGQADRTALPKKSTANPFTKAAKAVRGQLGEWLTEPLEIYKYEEEYIALPAALAPAVSFLLKRLRVVNWGIPMAEIKQRDRVPLHPLTMSHLFRQEAFHTVALDHAAALQYLSRQPISVEAPTGWLVPTFKGLPLGFAKKVQNRVNNYYPQHWRIRMNLPAQDQWFHIGQLAE